MNKFNNEIFIFKEEDFAETFDLIRKQSEKDIGHIKDYADFITEMRGLKSYKKINNNIDRIKLENPIPIISGKQTMKGLEFSIDLVDSIRLDSIDRIYDYIKDQETKYESDIIDFKNAYFYTYYDKVLDKYIKNKNNDTQLYKTSKNRAITSDSSKPSYKNYRIFNNFVEDYVYDKIYSYKYRNKECDKEKHLLNEKYIDHLWRNNYLLKQIIGYYTQASYTIHLLNGYGVYYEYNNKKTIPMPTKSLYYMANCTSQEEDIAFKFISAILNDLSQYSYSMKDLKNEFMENPEYLKSPYQVNDYLNSDNKTEFFRNKKKYVREKDVKNFPILYSSYIREISPKLTKNSIDVFRNQLKEIREDKYFILPDVSECVNPILEECYRNIYNKRKVQYDEGIINDYIRMSLLAKNKINLNLTYNQLVNEHDRLSLFFETKNLKEIKVNKNKVEVYEKLLIKGYKMLKTPEEFIEEGKRQSNCVASYYEDYAYGDCAIFSGSFEGKRYTLRIVYDKQTKLFCIDELRGFANEIAGDRVVEFVEKQLNIDESLEERKENARR